MIIVITVGSVTLLKWKLLATPQLGGASSYFSNITHPGVHVKSWRGSPKNEKVVTNDNSNISNTSSRTIGEELGTSVDYTPSSSSSPSTTTVGHSLSGNHGDHRRVTGIYSRVKPSSSAATANTASNSSTANDVSGMNDISGLLLNTNNNNDNVLSNALPNSDNAVPHPTMVGSNATGRFNPVLKMGWLPGMKQPISSRNVGLASLIDDKVD